MYFAIVKLVFEDEGATSGDRKDLRTLVEKIRSKFKVAAAMLGENEGDGLAIAALGSSEERLTQTLDAISDFCEDSGFGRIASEQALMDHMDTLQEDPSQDDDDGRNH